MFALSPVLGISALPFLSLPEAALPFEASFLLEVPFSPEPEFPSFFGLSGVLSFFGAAVSLFSISFVECASLKQLLQSAQYRYSVLPSASSLTSFASMCFRPTWLAESISIDLLSHAFKNRYGLKANTKALFRKQIRYKPTNPAENTIENQNYNIKTVPRLKINGTVKIIIC